MWDDQRDGTVTIPDEGSGENTGSKMERSLGFLRGGPTW